MADIEKISVGGTSYDVRDALAAHTLSDIAVAGDNIEFLRDIRNNYSVQGSLTINNGVASGFSTSNYIYKDEIWNTIVNAGSFTFQSKFKVTAGSSSNLLIYNYASSSNQFLIGCCDTLGRVEVNINGTSYYSAQNFVVTGVDYWLRFTYDSTTPSILVELSTDGSTFNTAISQSSVGKIGLIGSPARIGMCPNNTGFQGSIDLVETSFVDSNGNPLWKLVGLQSDKLIVKAIVPSITVDQTYNSASSNPQSGVAIDGAGFLRNLSTGTNSVDVNYAGTSKNSVTMGANTTSASSAITFGSSAKGNPYGVSIGRSAGTAGAAGNNSIAIGNNSSSSQYTGGCTAGTNSTALGSMTFARGNNSVAVGGATAMFQAAQAAGEGCVSIGFMALSGADSTTNSVDPTYTPTVGDVAIGGAAIASGGHAIQIGQGTNTTAQTLSVGFGNDTSSNPLNYQLLDSTGTIPSARMPSDVLKNTATGSNSICILGNASGDASGSRSVSIGTDSYASQNNCVAIGNYAAATGYTSVAVGMCQATANYAIQLGTGKNVDANTFSVGLSGSLNVRLLNSNGTIPGERMALQGTEAPTTSTAGSIGQFYVDTTNQIGYICVSAADSTYVWKQITA